MKRRTNRITLPSCWEQLRTGKAWQRLSLALLVAVMTMTAQTAQAQSNPTTYDELVTAINDVTAGGTVTLGGDIDLGSLGSSNGIEIETDANFTLDLNGHVLKGSTTNAVIYVKDGTTLAITDGAGGGSIVNEHTSEGCAVKNSGTVTISGGTFSGRSGLYNCSDGTANVGACTIKGCDNGILNESTLNLTALPTFGSGTDANDSDIKLYPPYKIITFSADIAAAPANPIVVSYYDFDPPVTFTSGYATHCAGIDPADMFTYYGGATTNIIATLDGDEVQFMLIPIPYLDESGQEQTLDDYNVIGASQTFYSDWYVVTRNVTLSSLSFSDDAYIILCDGAKLTVKDNNVRGDITPGNDRSITIYGQPAGSGAIEAGAIKVNTSKSIGANFTLCGGNLDINRLEACNIYIYDGSITATTANNKTAIYSGSLTQINGGNVTVTANGCNGIESAGGMVDIRGGQVTVTATGDNCNGIQADEGEIEISGGQVTANATGTNSYGMRGYASSEIYLGWTNATDFITASSFATAADGVVTVGKNFLAYIDDNAISAGTASAIVTEGEVSEDVLNIIGGKTLVPFDHNVVKTTDSDITVGGHAVAEADFTLDEDGDGTDDAYYFVADEGDELTLGYTGDVYDDEIVVYMVRDANRKDITASVMSGSTLTMPAGNVTVRASKADLSGDCGTDGHEEDVTWSYDPATTTLTISGSGEMGDNPWENVLKYIITKVVIGDGVTTIVRRAFRNHAALTDVTIGSGVVTIEENAFDGCAALTGVTIPDGVTTINNDVFRDCSSLTSIDIPKSVTEIEGNIFSGCTSLTGIAVDPANMDYKNDDRGALLSKDGKDFIIYPIGNTATSYDIPYGVTSIEGSAFIGSTALTALTIPYGVTRIKKSAFEGCSGLTSIIIPASVKNIAVDAFLECTSMKDVYCYVIDPSALSWTDNNCDDFKDDKDNTTCHVFDKDAFDAKWATGGGDDVCVTFVGDLATIPFNLTELEGVSHLAALAGKTLPVQFSRTYTTGSGANKASTVCLPFDFDKPDTETVGTFYTFGGVSDDTGEYVVTMNEVTDATLTAGTPYMFVPKTSDKLTQGNAAFTVPVEGFAGASSATNGSWQFKGTFEKKTWESGQTNLYGFAGKEYYLSNGSQIASDDIGSFRRFDYGTCAAFRCYLLAPESSGARGVSKAGSLPETLKVRLVKADGTTTAIGTLDTRTGEVEFGDDWYDLNGRRLDVKPTAKGVYINNGKKIVIKN